MSQVFSTLKPSWITQQGTSLMKPWASLDRGTQRTALHLACSFGHSKMAHILVNSKCKLDLRDVDNKTALIHAVQFQKEKCATLLLDHDADPNVADISGNTALHYAILGENRTIVEKLLSCSADMNMKNKDGFTPLALAQHEKKKQMVSLLLKSGTALPTVNEMESNQQQTSENEEGRRPETSSKRRNLDTDLQESAKTASGKTTSMTDTHLQDSPKTASRKPTSKTDTDLQDSAKTASGKTTSMTDTHLQDSPKTAPRKPTSKTDTDLWDSPKPESRKPTSKTDTDLWDSPKPESRKPTSKTDTHLLESAKTASRNTTSITVDEGPKEDFLWSNPGLDNSWDLSDEEACKVSDHCEKKEYLLPENHMLKDENAKLRLGKGTVKNQNQGMEKKYFENMKIVKEKNDDPQNTIKHNKEILTETIFQHNGQLNVPTAEITMLNLKLENENQNRERLEREIESYKSRLATVKQDHEQCQASQRDIQLAFQRERDESVSLRDKMNFDMSDLKDNNEILPQELSKIESKSSSLEIELNHTRDDLRKNTLVLECQQRAATKTEYYLKEMEHLYKKKQDKLPKDVVKERSLEEKLSHLQSENMLLRQQLDAARNKADNKEKTVINTQDQFQDIIKALQTENEKQSLMLHERNKELTTDRNNLKEIINQYENDKAEGDAFVSQLQQELADTLRKQSVLEASLEVTSRDHMNVEDETQDLKEKLDENRSQVEEENKKQKTDKKEVEGNIYYVATAVSNGIIQQTKSTQTDDQQYPMENEHSDRFILKEDKEEKQGSDLLYEEEMEQLINKQQYTKEVEINPQLETTVRTQEMEMNIISDSYEKEYLLRENHMLRDENAKLRLEIDTVKNQNQEDIKIIVEKNDHLNNITQLTEELFEKTLFENVAQLQQLPVLTAENALLNFDLKNEKQNRERLETEVESYKSRLATALQDHEQCQASKRDLQLIFQAERHEWFCLRDKMNFDMSNLKDNNESLCQELSKAESKFSSLEIELNHTRVALRERTLVLEGVQRALSQTQHQKKELEHVPQEERDKLHKYVGKQGYLEEKLSHLQSENKLLQQQLDAAHNKADNQAKTLINIQDQLQDTIKALQTKYEKQGLMLNERNNECRHFSGRIYQYENDKAKREVVVTQLQQKLADALKKPSLLEVSLDVTSHHRMNLEKETQDLKRKLDENKSQIDDLTAKLETTSSKCLRLDGENKFFQQELLSLKAIQEKCEKLENENLKLKQEVVNLKKELQTNMVEFREVQQNERIVEERARPDSQQVLFVQTQTLSQARLDPLRENHNTSVTLLQLRVEELEFELSRTKMSQDCKSKKYNKLHLKEIKSLTKTLNKTKERLEDIRMELLLKEADNKFLQGKLKLQEEEMLSLKRPRHEASPRLAWC